MTAIEEMLPNDISVNKTLSKYGADHILQLFNDEPVDILTHCNTGSLATAGYGTALGKSSYTHPWPWAHETKISSCIPSLIFHFICFLKKIQSELVSVTAPEQYLCVMVQENNV